MSKCTLLSTGSIEGSVSLARRDLALRIAVGALLAGTSKFGTQYAFAASAGATLTAEVYARLKAASLVVMLEGQMKGSGALVDAGGLVITSAHGIGRKGSRVEVLTAAAERLRAEVVAVDLGHDLALLKLPTYESWLMEVDGISKGEPKGWSKWVRMWTAEENRHGDLLNKYIYLSGRVNMRQMEISTQHLIADGMEIGTARDPYRNFVYTSFQEMATNISHRRTATMAKKHGNANPPRDW